MFFGNVYDIIANQFHPIIMLLFSTFISEWLFDWNQEKDQESLVFFTRKNGD